MKEYGTEEKGKKRDLYSYRTGALIAGASSSVELR